MLQISCFFQEKTSKNAENDYFDQCLECAAPKRWSKYTTTVSSISFFYAIHFSPSCNSWKNQKFFSVLLVFFLFRFWHFLVKFFLNSVLRHLKTSPVSFFCGNINILYYPPAREANREVTNLTERKNSHTPVYGVREFVWLL